MSGSITLTSAVASADNLKKDSIVANVNDGNVTTGIKSYDGITMPQYITLKWNKAKIFNYVELFTAYALGQGPTNWDVEVSDDGVTNWRTVASSGDVIWKYNTSSIESKIVKFPVMMDKKGLRIKINSANLQWKHYVVNELKVALNTQVVNAVTGVSLLEDELTLMQGEQYLLTAVVSPTNATN